MIQCCIATPKLYSIVLSNINDVAAENAYTSMSGNVISPFIEVSTVYHFLGCIFGRLEDNVYICIKVR